MLALVGARRGCGVTTTARCLARSFPGAVRIVPPGEADGAGSRTLVDCSAGSADGTEPTDEAIGIAGRALVVSENCLPDLRRASRTVDRCRGLGTPVAGLVTNRTYLRFGDVENLVGCRLLGALPPARTGDPLADPLIRRASDETCRELRSRAGDGRSVIG